MKFNGTKGKWKAKLAKGWGKDTIGIFHKDFEKPFFTTVKPKEYYTDYPTRTDHKGEVWTVCSTSAAEKAGNYVATKETKDNILNEEKKRSEVVVEALNISESIPFSITELKERYDKMLSLLKGVQDVVNDSEGISGYHLNGNVADWDELQEIIDVFDFINKEDKINHAKP